MADRGDFRGIYTVLTEDPDFQDMGPDAQLVWFHLKLKLGPSGIDVLDAAEAVIAERSGMVSTQIKDGMRILSERGWLVRDRNIIWLRNALRFEPSRNLGNENHVKSISAHLASLPKRPIVNEFADYYALPRPFGDVMSSGCHPDTKPITEDGVRSTEDGTAPPLERAREEPDRLAGWLDGNARVLESCTFLATTAQRNEVYEQYGPPGLRPNAWKQPDGTSVAAPERPRLMALALSVWASEGQKRLIGGQFDGTLCREIRNDYEARRAAAVPPATTPRAPRRGVFPEPERSTSGAA